MVSSSRLHPSRQHQHGARDIWLLARMIIVVNGKRLEAPLPEAPFRVPGPYTFMSGGWYTFKRRVHESLEELVIRCEDKIAAEQVGHAQTYAHTACC